jgi:hypothetical protein
MLLETELTELVLPEAKVLEDLNKVSTAKRVAAMVSAILRAFLFALVLSFSIRLSFHSLVLLRLNSLTSFYFRSFVFDWCPSVSARCRVRGETEAASGSGSQEEEARCCKEDGLRCENACCDERSPAISMIVLSTPTRLASDEDESKRHGPCFFPANQKRRCA